MAQQDPLAALAAQHGVKIDLSASDALNQLATASDVTTGAPPAEQPTNSLGDFAEGFVEAQPVHPVATGNALLHPLKTAQDMLLAQGRLAQEAQEAFATGDYTRGGRKAIEYLIPIFGPIMSKAGDDAAKGQIMRAIGESLGVATNLFFLRGAPVVADTVSNIPGAGRVGMGPGQLLAESPLGKTTSSPALPPPPSWLQADHGAPGVQRVPGGQPMPGVQQARPGPMPPAMPQSVAGQVSQFADQQQVPIPASVRTGNPAVRGLQQWNAKSSIPAGMAEERKMGEYAGAMQRAGNRLTEQIAPGIRPDAELAGASGRDMLQEIAVAYRDKQGAAYDRFRTLEQEPGYARQVTVQQPGTAHGSPVVVAVPQWMQLPVDLTRAQTALRPILHRLSKQWPEARKASSPGYAALKNIVEGPSMLSASELDGNLSGLKAIAREQGGIAKAAVRVVEDALQETLDGADPQVREALDAGRAATRSKVAVDAAVKKLRENAQDPYRALTPEDVHRLEVAAPEAVPVIARGWLQMMLNRAFEAPGQVSHAAALYGDWMRVNPKVKLALYGPERLRTITLFFRTAAEVGRLENPSGTAAQVASILKAAHGVTDALTFWHPLSMAKAGLVELTQYQLAKALWNPAFTKVLTKALKTPRGTSAGYEVAAQLVNAARAIGIVTAPAQEMPKAAEQTPPRPEMAQAPSGP